MTNENHTILGGKVHLFRRNGGEKWHCYTFLKGKKRRKTTKPDSLSLAKEIAEQVHDYVLVLANTGLRPDAAKNLQHRDVAVVRDEGSGEKILEILAWS
jgi:hypothetical protein